MYATAPILSRAAAPPYSASRGRRDRRDRVGRRAHYERGRAQNPRGRISGTRTKCHSGASSRDVGEAPRPARVSGGRELPLSGLRRRRKVLLDSPRTRSRRSDARADLGDLASASRRRTPSRFLLRPSQPQRRNSDRPLQLGARTWPELVAVFADSVLVPAGSTRTPTAAKVLRYWRRGTEINLAVIGHWPHDKAPASALRL
jgi:hypothetical protein